MSPIKGRAKATVIPKHQLCSVPGCGQEHRWWIYRKGDPTRNVCKDCRDEMIATMGWNFGGPS